MPEIARPITILLADDDADDRMLTRDALAESRLANNPSLWRTASS